MEQFRKLLEPYKIIIFIAAFWTLPPLEARGHVLEGDSTHKVEEMPLGAAIEALAGRYDIEIKGLARVPAKTVSVDHDDSIHQLAFLLLELSYVVLYDAEGGVDKIIVLGGAARLKGADKAAPRPSPESAALVEALFSDDGGMTRVSSGFGLRRDPILGYSKLHKGIDFAAPTGTPVTVIDDGVITQTSQDGSNGYYLRIRHGDGVETAYAHMSGFAPGMRKGVRLRAKQVIGFVGSTGRSTGPHLHFEVLRDGQQVDPLSIAFQ